MTKTKAKLAAACAVLALLSGCSEPLDLDLRGQLGGVDTSDAARKATAKRPRPDNRGVISYPNYQVAIARRGDTLTDVANRIGMNAAELGRYNGISADATLRAGEVIALPKRVAEPSPATGAETTGPIKPPEKVDITELAEGAIDKAQTPSPAKATAKGQTGIEPIRHRVQRGETAYTVSRLYKVSVRSLADWNGLDSDFSIREGQYLLIPTPLAAAPKRAVTKPDTKTTKPGDGSPTPVPPSASKPLPAADEKPLAEKPKETAATPNLGKKQTKASGGSGKLAYPVRGRIIREYSKGKNDGIDIAAPAGTSIGAAAGGTVAAITANADQVPIIVVKHPDNLLTVYANVDKISVKKGDKISRGQRIAQVRSGNAAYVHFEVRKGFESVDPLPYLQ